MEWGEEREIMPGVFLTQRASASDSKQSAASQDSKASSSFIPSAVDPAQDNLDQLEWDLKQEENALHHLLRSCDELKDYLQNADDEDVREALEENVDVIEHKKERIQNLKDRLAEARSFAKCASADSSTSSASTSSTSPTPSSSSSASSSSSVTSSTSSSSSSSSDSSSITDDAEGLYL